VLTGNVGNNVLAGLGANDTLDGSAGDDVLIGGSGVDSLTGGDGRDVFVFDAALGTVDVIADFDVADDLIALDVGTAIFGGGAAPFDGTLFVQSLEDTNVDPAAISMTGHTKPCEAVDYTFTSASGVCIDEDTFVIGASADDANDYLVYNDTTGALYYDADGNGGGAAVQIATLDAGLKLTSASFVLV
jgi:Ca2+-binding RTX toxin-like protein